jgi:GNAT superfamily N-acetyltransferase/catechol 2,3-dioxygenase-like lactoylglutathione lyase family enzyme
VIINRYEGSRSNLRELFEMAEDSAEQLNSYIEDGEVFVVREPGEGVVGQLQLIPLEIVSGEIKNLAVMPAFRRRGLGSALVHQAVDASSHNGWNRLIVRTATADTGNLRFYQQLGFRCVAIEPNAFTPAGGYPPDLMIDDIPLRDGIVLSQSLKEGGDTPPAVIAKPSFQVRVARQTGDLETAVAFYRDGLGLPEIDRFADHAGYDGVLLDLPGTGAHLEFTATSHLIPPTPHVEDLLVLFLGSREAVNEALTRVGDTSVPSANPYWDRIGVTILDPDGFRVVLVAEAWAP